MDDNMQARFKANRERTLAALREEKEKRLKDEAKKRRASAQAYEAKLEQEKQKFDDCEDCEICCESRAPHRYFMCENRGNPHKHCEVCIRTHLHSSIYEQQSHKMACMGGGCKALYPQEAWEQILDDEALEMRERLRTRASNKDVKGMTHCDYCDYACVLKPSAMVFECQNRLCLKRRCLLCKERAHDRLTCAEVKDEQGNKGKGKKRSYSDLRRMVEEAKSEALIRKCQRCRLPFVKLDGCNHMKCVCGNQSCYTCKAQGINHMHFSRGCTVYGSNLQVEEADVKEAERITKEKIKRDNPEVTDTDLEPLKMSESVKKDDEKRKRREDYEMSGRAWYPGMAIDGADADTMRDIQMQMRGAGFRNRDHALGINDSVFRGLGSRRARRGGESGGLRPPPVWMPKDLHDDAALHPPLFSMGTPAFHRHGDPGWPLPRQTVGSHFAPRFGQPGPVDWPASPILGGGLQQPSWRARNQGVGRSPPTSWSASPPAVNSGLRQQTVNASRQRPNIASPRQNAAAAAIARQERPQEPLDFGSTIRSRRW